ncbi:E3 ubiquitin-protein ligase TRIM58 isoform X2 [Opisthocomus hoazin]|uniref:E3 ubiquitin-protein ligase TRIM58 isoform X2 n=1 Tax=Opisthocomus hoazin TaxID=30419 RepID=UPI003F53A66F
MALAEALERLQEEAVCPICLEYMSEPVSVDCGHNFCRGCIAEHCQEKGLRADGPFSCPQCRASCHRSGFRPNKQLANIVESIRQLGLRGCPGTEPGTPLCAQHDERLKLFCEEDKEAICVVCRESLHHRSHTVYPIEEAAQVYKVRLQKSLEHLSKEVEDVKRRESAERMKTQECKEAVKKRRERIVSEFGKLHRLLADEEKLLLQKLEEEEKQILLMISENLARLVEQKCVLEELILEIKEKTQQPAHGLLKDMKIVLSSPWASLSFQVRVDKAPVPQACVCDPEGKLQHPRALLGHEGHAEEVQSGRDSGPRDSTPGSHRVRGPQERAAREQEAASVPLRHPQAVQHRAGGAGDSGLLLGPLLLGGAGGRQARVGLGAVPGVCQPQRQRPLLPKQRVLGAAAAKWGQL